MTPSQLQYCIVEFRSLISAHYGITSAFHLRSSLVVIGNCPGYAMQSSGSDFVSYQRCSTRCIVLYESQNKMGKIGFCMRCIVLYESQNKIGVDSESRLESMKSTTSCCSHIASFTTSKAAMYSSFVYESVVHF